MSNQDVSLEQVEQIVETLPFGRYINVSKHVTYDVSRIVEQIIEERYANVWVNSRGETGGLPASDEVTAEDIMERVEQYATDDFSCGWGHEVSLKDLVFTDEHGEEL